MKAMEWMPRTVMNAFSRGIRSEEYSMLSNDPQFPSRLLPPYNYRRRYGCSWRGLGHVFTLRRILFCLACTPIFVLLAILCQGVPPSYEDIRAFERRLPQHSLVASDHHFRYIRFPGHLWGHGLNNVLQEALLMSYLAHKSNLSFVFEDYTWSHIPLPWTIYDFALRPARIPLNAIISGPTAGGPFPDTSTTPLAVSAEFYEHVCGGPNVEQYVISSADAPNDADGAVMMEWWIDQLAHVRASCIEVDSSPHVLFDRFLFGGPRILSLWEPLASSPILSDFSWSPLVQSAVARNFALLQPASAKDIYSSDSRSTLQGLVALHLRRGDYIRHCPNLAKWGADYMGLNQHPSLVDRFDPRPFANDSSLLLPYYLEHCLPTTEQVVSRLRDIRREHPGLRRVYVLSNEWAWALGSLKRALEEDGWEDLVSSVDIQLDAEQYYVSMAVDMAIAEKAEVFVGNGFSSLTSNVVMLRMAKGMDARSNRFL